MSALTTRSSKALLKIIFMLKKSIFFQGGSLLLIGMLVYAYYLYHKPRGSADSDPAIESLAADSLYSQYSRDENAANLKYLGKVIEVKGVCAGLSDRAGLKILLLSAQNSGGGINCQLFPANDHLPALPAKGDTVLVKGKCTGFLLDVNLVDCVLKYNQ